MKKGTLGGYKPVSGGSSDPECSHVIVTKEEYERLLREKAAAEQETRNTKYDAEKKIREAQQQAAYTAQEAADRARKTVEGMEAAFAAEKAESDYQRRLNANLLRISKERANAERRLKPKKAHTGYVVVTSEEKEYRYRDGDRRWRRAKLWETVLQSPYPVDFTEEQARMQIEKDLFPEEENCNASEPISGLAIGRLSVCTRSRWGWSLGICGCAANSLSGVDLALRRAESFVFHSLCSRQQRRGRPSLPCDSRPR